MATQDPYQMLGVLRTASQDEIKNAYRNLAKKHHPDLNPGSREAQRKFQELSAAYDLVGSPDARAKYDRGESSNEQPSPGRGPSYRHAHERYAQAFAGGEEEELFASIFGGRWGGGGRAREDARIPGQDTLYRMEVDLRQATLGGEKEIQLPGGKKLHVKIPPGVTDGTRLRFAGLGGPSMSGGPPGNAYVELSVRPDSRFKREGNDLALELPVSIREAIEGSEVRVPTLEGDVILKIPPRSNSGTRLRLLGKGIFNRATGRRGDEYVVLRVMLPDQMDPEFEQALKRWESRHPYDPRAA